LLLKLRRQPLIIIGATIPQPLRGCFPSAINNPIHRKTSLATKSILENKLNPNRRQASIATKSLLINEMINLKQSIIETARRKTRKWSELQPFW
jgi:hypothetical protein